MLRLGLLAACLCWWPTENRLNALNVNGLPQAQSSSVAILPSCESIQPLAFDLDFFAVAEPAADTATASRILMFDYPAYDSAYAVKAESYLRQNTANFRFTQFWKGSPAEFAAALANCQVAVLPYPSKGEEDLLRAYGAALKNFARNGGTIVVNGTHEYDVLRNLGLFDLDFGYYFPTPKFHQSQPGHPILAGLTPDFSTENYAYPLDVSDPDFVSLADVKGYPAVGYKFLGRGAVVYLGPEFYFDEKNSTQLLVNAVNWCAKIAKPKIDRPTEKSAGPSRPRRLTLRLAPNEFPAKDSVGLKIYPNPYHDRADIELAVGEPTQMTVEVNDQLGQLVAVMLPRKTLAQGKHLLELPDLPAGVYFVKCKYGNTTTVRKVVKTSN